MHSVRGAELTGPLPARQSAGVSGVPPPPVPADPMPPEPAPPLPASALLPALPALFEGTPPSLELQARTLEMPKKRLRIRSDRCDDMGRNLLVRQMFPADLSNDIGRSSPSAGFSHGLGWSILLSIV